MIKKVIGNNLIMRGTHAKGQLPKIINLSNIVGPLSLTQEKNYSNSNNWGKFEKNGMNSVNSVSPVSPVSSVGSDSGQAEKLKNDTDVADNKENGQTLIEQIKNNLGLKDYLSKVYKKSAYGFGTTLFVGTLTLMIAMGLGIGSTTEITMWATSIPLLFYSMYKINTLKNDTVEEMGKFVEKENIEKNRWYKTFCLTNGIIVSPPFLFSMEKSATIVPIVLACTGGVFVASSFYALKQKDLNLIKYQVPLGGCLGGILYSLLTELIMMGMGYYDGSLMLNIGTTVFSTGVFTALIATETQRAIATYQKCDLDSTKVAVNISTFLNVSVLFLNFLNMLGKFYNGH
jgi:FtsH-binding integral membrane protein